MAIIIYEGLIEKAKEKIKKYEEELLEEYSIYTKHPTPQRKSVLRVKIATLFFKVNNELFYDKRAFTPTKANAFYIMKRRHGWAVKELAKLFNYKNESTLRKYIGEIDEQLPPFHIKVVHKDLIGLYYH